jgi:hypothetical protein
MRSGCEHQKTAAGSGLNSGVLRQFYVFLLHEAFNGGVQIFKRLHVSLNRCVHDAVIDMVLQDDLGSIAQSRADSGKLNQNISAVPAILHHALDRFEMPQRSAESIQNRLRIRMGVRMRMLMFMCMHMEMLMRLFVDIVVGMRVIVVVH